SLPGVDLGTSTLPLTASGYRIEVNGGPTVNGHQVAVNFSKLPGGKFTVPTAASTSLTLPTASSTTISDGTDSPILPAGATTTDIINALGHFASFGGNPANVQVTPNGPGQFLISAANGITLPTLFVTGTGAVLTNAGEDFTYTSGLLRVAIDNATLNIGDYVYVSGGLSFTKLTQLQNVQVTGGGPSKTMNAFAFG